jgi:hypothetical protein
MEVSVSILLVMTIVLAGLGVRYLAVKEARRGDAYNAAGRLGEMLLEGWRSAGEPKTYDPVARFAGQTVLAISTAAMAPPAPSGFTVLNGPHGGRFQVVLDHVNYFVTLAYIDADPTWLQRPAVLNATIGFQHNYQSVSVAVSGSYVRLTTYK